MKKIIVILTIIISSLLSVNSLNAAQIGLSYVTYGGQNSVQDGVSNTEPYALSTTYMPLFIYNNNSVVSNYKQYGFSAWFNSPVQGVGISSKLVAEFDIAYSKNLTSTLSSQLAYGDNPYSLIWDGLTTSTYSSSTEIIASGCDNSVCYERIRVTSISNFKTSVDMKLIALHANSGTSGLYFCSGIEQCLSSRYVKLNNFSVDVTISEDPNLELLNNINGQLGGIKSVIQSNLEQTFNIIDKAEETNKKLEDLNNSITDDSAPDTSEFGDVSGWLPPGPVDSILTLPSNVFTSISTALNSNCTSLSVPLPFIDKDLDIMCGTEFYSNISGLNVFLTTLFTILGGVVLYKYFIYLYHWIDDTISMKEKDEKEWGAT